MKNYVRIIRDYCGDSDYRFRANVKLGLYHSMPDMEYLRKMYKACMGTELDLENPITFNEKLQWLKLHDRKPIYTTMVDKYAAKEYVASIIGEEYIIPTLGVWDSFDDINITKLPDQFVLKCTHDSGGLVICRDKSCFNIAEARKTINKSLNKNFYYYGREWPYKDVKPRIIAEKYMEDPITKELRDYKFFCFGGIAKCYKVDFDRFIGHRANYFTVEGDLMKLGEEICPPDFEKDIPKPANLIKMKELAEKLTAGYPFLRADFYDVDGQVYFGELTFFPASGLGKFIYDGNDEMLGSWLTLPKSIGGGYYIVYKDLICFLNMAKNEEQREGLSDYKIHCFNGEPKIILVCRDRFSKPGLTEDFFDTNWNHLDVKRMKHGNAPGRIGKPKELGEMLDLSIQLSDGVPFLRTDFYTINGRVYFGELTFYPASGFEKFVPESFDREMGEWITLSE